MRKSLALEKKDAICLFKKDIIHVPLADLFWILIDIVLTIKMLMGIFQEKAVAINICKSKSWLDMTTIWLPF